MKASAQVAPPGEVRQPEKLHLNPNFEREEDLINESGGGLLETKPTNEPSFWREIEGQIFLAELLNLTKDQLNEFKPDLSGKKPDKCQEFNKSLDETQRQINDLLELTTLERNYQMGSTQQRENWIKSMADVINLPSPAKMSQAKYVQSSLSQLTKLFFECLASIELGEDEEKSKKYKDLRENLLPMTHYMRKLDSLLGSESSKLKNNIDDFSFAKLLPEDQDLNLDSLKKDRKNSLIRELKSAYDALQLDMKKFADETKDFLDPLQ